MKIQSTTFSIGIILAIIVMISASHVFAQVSGITLQCGDIIDSETTTSEPIQNWVLDIDAGTVIDLYVQPLGDSFNVAFALSDSGGSSLEGINLNSAGLAEQLVGYRIGSSNPIIRVGGQPLGQTYFDSLDLREYRGAYTISLGCTLRDGTVINPGDIPQEAQPTQASGENPVTTNFSGYGFPGLQPVDFTNAFLTNFNLGQISEGRIPPSGDSVLGYTFNANANDRFELTFTKSGNLNLGLVVLSAENQVVFQASLVTSETMSTRLTLPTAGQYTIGVFRIDLLPPAAPEATAFQVQGTLNP